MFTPAERISFFSLRNRCFVWVLLGLGLLLASCTVKQSAPSARSEVETNHRQHREQREEAEEPGSLPNPRLTPGATLEVTKEDVCISGYTEKVRDVPVAVKRRAYSEYNTAYVRKAYEVDHLIPLELGGSNSLRNLWPEAYNLTWGAHVKDQLENRLHELVCQDSLPLETAQNWIAGDWIAAYRRVFHSGTPVRRQRRSTRQEHTVRRRNDYQP